MTTTPTPTLADRLISHAQEQYVAGTSSLPAFELHVAMLLTSERYRADYIDHFHVASPLLPDAPLGVGA